MQTKLKQRVRMEKKAGQRVLCLPHQRKNNLYLLVSSDLPFNIYFMSTGKFFIYYLSSCCYRSHISFYIEWRILYETVFFIAAYPDDSEDEKEVKENKKENPKPQKKSQKSMKNDYDLASLNSNYRRFSSDSNSSDMGKVRKSQVLYVSVLLSSIVL